MKRLFCIIHCASRLCHSHKKTQKTQTMNRFSFVAVVCLCGNFPSPRPWRTLWYNIASPATQQLSHASGRGAGG